MSRLWIFFFFAIVHLYLAILPFFFSCNSDFFSFNSITSSSPILRGVLEGGPILKNKFFCIIIIIIIIQWQKQGFHNCVY